MKKFVKSTIVNRWLLTALLGLSTLLAKAHQPDISSTMLIEHAPNEWVLQVRVALTALEYEVKVQFGDSAYATPEEFEALVIEHLKNNLSVQFNGEEPSVLQSKQVRLGHETSIIFKVSEVPAAIESISVTNSSFGEIQRSQSALIVFKNGFAKNQFLLNADNHYTANLLADDSKFTLLNKAKPTNISILPSNLTLVAAIVVLIGVALFLWVRLRANRSVPKALRVVDFPK